MFVPLPKWVTEKDVAKIKGNLYPCTGCLVALLIDKIIKSITYVK
jgi:hypothetical protein